MKSWQNCFAHQQAAVMGTPKAELGRKNRFGAFVILDLETSDLPEYNYYEVSILEICMYGFPISEMQKRCMKFVEKEGEKEEEEQAEKTNNKEEPTLHHIIKQDICEIPPTPRALTKLSLVVNPRRRLFPEVSKLTGLDNYMLENFGNFNEKTGNMVLNFIKLLPQPVCLVAHNGKFDFTILKATLNKFNVELPNDVMCLDSLRAFYEVDQEHDSERATKAVEILENAEMEKKYDKEGESRHKLNETTPKRLINRQDSQMNCKRARTDNSDCTPQECCRPETPKTSVINKGTLKSRRALFQDDKNLNINEELALSRLLKTFYPPKNVYKLENIYKRVHGEITKTTHQAETDVELLMRLVLHYGDDFLDYAQTWAVLFSAIPIIVKSTN